MVHVSGQSVTTLLDGREGNELKALAQRLKTTLNLTAEQIDDYYDAFLMFPRDSHNKISSSSIQIFYENSDINLEYEDGMKALHAFTSSRTVNSIDFESFVVNMEKWMKKVSIFLSCFLLLSPTLPQQEIHYPEVLKMACTIYDEEGPNVESVRELLINIDGPTLSHKSLSALAESINKGG
jgi:hypothetical protein